MKSSIIYKILLFYKKEQIKMHFSFTKKNIVLLYKIKVIKKQLNSELFYFGLITTFNRYFVERF